MRSMVEGAHRPALLDAAGQHPLQILEHFNSGKTERPESLLGGYPVPALVLLHSAAQAVSLTIHFDRQPRLETGKVQRKRMERELPPELEAARTMAKFPP